MRLPYGRQVRSWLSHRKGGPPSTSPYVAFPPGGRPQLRIAVAGDVGDRGERVRRTGAAVARLAADDPWDGLLLLGDTVYPAGNPDRLDATVFGPFGPVLDGGAELFAVLGNHDVRGRRAGELVDRLGMPGRWWARRFPAGSGGLLLVGLDSNRRGDAGQRAWLAEVLATSDARWKVVALHHPPYSAGYQGSDLRTRAAFVPLFERFGVHLVLSGHEHDYQRSVPLAGVTYVVTGGASRVRRTGEEPFTAASWSWPHFVELAVFEDRLEGRAIGVDGRVGDTWTIRG